MASLSHRIPCKLTITTSMVWMRKFRKVIWWRSISVSGTFGALTWAYLSWRHFSANSFLKFQCPKGNLLNAGLIQEVWGGLGRDPRWCEGLKSHLMSRSQVNCWVSCIGRALLRMRSVLSSSSCPGEITRLTNHTGDQTGPGAQPSVPTGVWLATSQYLHSGSGPQYCLPRSPPVPRSST